jgi:Kef-type K+ transport system membrane component KefB
MPLGSLVLGGIILGPSVMGRIPNYMNTVFPTASLPYLNLIATIGLVFFLFQVGLEVDIKLIKRDVRKSLTVGIMGMALPFAMGVAVSYGLYRLQNDPTIPFGSYLLFLGVAMSITVSTRYLDICRSIHFLCLHMSVHIFGM